MTQHGTVPNHHAHHAPFSGPMGVVAALSMITGRDEDARQAIRLSGLAAGEVVVDIGCGPGAAVRQAVRAGARAIGIDPAPIMLRTARILTRRGVLPQRRGRAAPGRRRNGTGRVVDRNRAPLARP